jgi:type I restriction enzyme S subunit
MKNNFWNCVPVSTVAEIVLGGTPSRNNPDYWDGEIKWASAADIASDQAKYIFSTKEKITEVGLKNSPAKLLGKDTVVITARGTVGAIRMLGTEMSFNQTCYGLVAKETIDPSFLYYALMFKINVLKSLSYGTVFDTITKNTFDSLAIPLPPLPEQRAIAAILGALDDKIELNRRMNRTLEEIAQTIYIEMIREVDTQCSILNFADLLSGGTPSTAVDEYWNGDIEWISAKDVSNARGIFILATEKKISRTGLENSAAKILPEKTSIVTARGTVGAHCMISKPMAMNQTNYGLKSKEGIGDYFIYFSLSNMIEKLRQQSYGTIFDTITTKTFQSVLCPQPSIKKINEFENQVKPIIDAVLINERESLILKYIRDELVLKLMQGKVRISL